MSLVKRLLVGGAMAFAMAVISLLLSYFNHDGVNKNHLIGMVIAGVIIGSWLVPSYIKKKSKEDH
ncbi:hypothetical protein [Halobacillus trueperi]|uniref:hypothetical protein n=1 Tax=Halobacillus trueperi TaxID=156205 RepID=UPI0037369B58